MDVAAVLPLRIVRATANASGLQTGMVGRRGQRRRNKPYFFDDGFYVSFGMVVLLGFCVNLE